MRQTPPAMSLVEFILDIVELSLRKERDISAKSQWNGSTRVVYSNEYPVFTLTCDSKGDMRVITEEQELTSSWYDFDNASDIIDWLVYADAI